MRPFWRLAREMMRHRRTLVLAVTCAFLSAAGLGLGLAGMIPVLSLILGDGESLRSLATEYNAGDPMIAVPAGLLESLPTDPFLSVVTIFIPLGLLTLLGAVLNFGHQYLSITTAAKTTAQIRQQVFRHVVHMPLSRVIERGPAEFVSRIVRDAADLQRGLIALISKTTAQITKGLAALIVAIAIQPMFTLLALAVGAVMAVVLKKLGSRIRRGNKGALKAQEGLLRIATESIQGLRGVKANTGEIVTMRKFFQENKRVIREELKVRTARALSSPILETLAVWTVGIVAIVAARFIQSGAIQSEEFIGALLALAVAGTSFRPIAGLANEIYAASAPAERLLDILDEDRERAPGRRSQFLPRHTQSLVFDNVSLTYPGADRPSLENVSLTVRHGERVALVGANGCGKTTLVSLLPRLLKPSSGRVLIDGVDIESVSLRGLRRQIGVVTQETIIFRGSIADNIAFGAEETSRGAIESACRDARADEFIQRLPGGYDADIAEQGASLSGGQRQRLAIARAILRDPAILVLDEATSQIDAESEELINTALATFCRDRTALIVAHRLATVLSADRIVVMDAGRIVGQGQHDELLADCPEYAALANTQLLGSRSAT